MLSILKEPLVQDFPHEIPERGRKVSSRRHVPGKWFTLIEGRGGRGPAVGGGGGEVIRDA